MNPYGKFEENGWKVEAFLPENDTEAADGWQVIAVRGETKKYFRVPMFYPPIFGPDVEDVAALKKAVALFLKENP